MLPAVEPTPYDDLNEFLAELVQQQQAILGDNFIGVYLQGSFAVGGFDRHSDVDFIAVINEDISDSHLDLLQEMHHRIFHLARLSWDQ